MVSLWGLPGLTPSAPEHWTQSEPHQWHKPLGEDSSVVLCKVCVEGTEMEGPECMREWRTVVNFEV